MNTLNNLEAEIRDLKELLTLELLPKVSEICTRKQIFIIETQGTASCSP